MPTYTFECEKCHETEDVVMKMSEYRSTRKCSCGGKQQRQYGTPQVIGDEFPNPIAVTTLKPVFCGPRGVDVVRSRSELNNLKKAHDRKYGTDLYNPR